MSSDPARDPATVGDETGAQNSAPDTHPASGEPGGLCAVAAGAHGAALRYELLDEIAHGGMGTVLLATDRTFGREVAGRTVPGSLAEAVEFATLCYKPFVRRYFAAVRLSARVFAATPS